MSINSNYRPLSDEPVLVNINLEDVLPADVSWEGHRPEYITVVFTSEGVIFDVISDNEAVFTMAYEYEGLIDAIQARNTWSELRNAMRSHPASQPRLHGIDGGGK